MLLCITNCGTPCNLTKDSTTHCQGCWSDATFSSHIESYVISISWLVSCTTKQCHNIGQCWVSGGIEAASWGGRETRPTNPRSHFPQSEQVYSKAPFPWPPGLVSRGKKSREWAKESGLSNTMGAFQTKSLVPWPLVGPKVTRTCNMVLKNAFYWTCHLQPLWGGVRIFWSDVICADLGIFWWSQHLEQFNAMYIGMSWPIILNIDGAHHTINATQ